MPGLANIGPRTNGAVIHSAMMREPRCRPADGCGRGRIGDAPIQPATQGGRRAQVDDRDALESRGIIQVPWPDGTEPLAGRQLAEREGSIDRYAAHLAGGCAVQALRGCRPNGSHPGPHTPPDTKKPPFGGFFASGGVRGIHSPLRGSPCGRLRRAAAARLSNPRFSSRSAHSARHEKTPFRGLLRVWRSERDSNPR